MTIRVSKDRIDMDDKILRKPVIQDYGETCVTANSSTSYTVDLTTGNVFNITMTGSCTFTFSNPPASGTLGNLTLILTQDSTGTRTAVWPGAVTWLSGDTPILSTAASAVDILTFYTIDGGTIWYGSFAAADLLPLSFMSTLTARGLTSNLVLCLDAGDSSSYSSGQSWLDRSGNGYDFFRGTTSGSDGTDPTFNGTAGNLSSSEYWSVDGGDYFTYDTTNETWMQNLHKDNAAFTFIGWIYVASGGTTDTLIGTRGANSGGNIGIVFGMNTTGDLIFESRNGTTNVADTASTLVVPIGTWACIGVSVGEASASGTFMLNGATETFTSTYTSPTASSATNTLKIGSSGAGADLFSSSSRIAAVMAWSSTLTAAQMVTVYEATKGRFGM